jgi:hypothetical protein
VGCDGFEVLDAGLLSDARAVVEQCRDRKRVFKEVDEVLLLETDSALVLRAL